MNQIEEDYQSWKKKSDILDMKEEQVLNLKEKLEKLKQEHRQTQANLLKLEGAIAMLANLIEEEETGGTDVG